MEREIDLVRYRVEKSRSAAPEKQVAQPEARGVEAGRQPAETENFRKSICLSSPN
jgi:hypothetical protein